MDYKSECFIELPLNNEEGFQVRYLAEFEGDYAGEDTNNRIDFEIYLGDIKVDESDLTIKESHIAHAYKVMNTDKIINLLINNAEYSE